MEFLRGPDGLDSTSDNDVKTYLLNGTWSGSTLKHYNAGVSKLLVFALERGIDRSLLLPIQPKVLYEFFAWASPPLLDNGTKQGPPPIKSTTVRNYLLGIKAWHLLHNFDYTHAATPRAKVSLKQLQNCNSLKLRKCQRTQSLLNISLCY